MKKDHKSVMGNLKEKFANTPTPPMQEVVPIKGKNVESEIEEIGFHIMIEKGLHTKIKIKSFQEGMTLKEWAIALMEREVKG